MGLAFAILDDNAERLDAMRSRLEDRFPQYEVCTFGDSATMIDWLCGNQKRTIAISLDHDLEPQPGTGSIDPGTGREVANYLAAQPVTCRIIVHSSNQFAADGMTRQLEDSGWLVDRVVPCDDLAWIEHDWFEAARDAILSEPVGPAESRDVVRRIQRAFGEVPELAGAPIDVRRGKQGVCLTGKVRSAFQRALAESLVAEILPQEELRNELEVEAPSA